MTDLAGGFASTGALLRRSYLTSGTAATFTQLAATQTLDVEGCGPGGGGAGAASTAGQASCGAGGGTGAWGRRRYTSVQGKTFTYTIGAAGVGGVAGANNGGTGTDTTFTDGTTQLTLPAGNAAAGAIAEAAATTENFTAGGAGGLAPTNADTGSASPGVIGGAGERVSGTVGKAGDGGSCPYGRGGRGLNTGGAGAAGAGYGAGGSGGCSLNGSAAVAGGDGAGGLLIIEEYG